MYQCRYIIKKIADEVTGYRYTLLIWAFMVVQSLQGLYGGTKFTGYLKLNKYVSKCIIYVEAQQKMYIL